METQRCKICVLKNLAWECCKPSWRFRSLLSVAAGDWIQAVGLTIYAGVTKALVGSSMRTRMILICLAMRSDRSWKHPRVEGVSVMGPLMGRR